MKTALHTAESGVDLDWFRTYDHLGNFYPFVLEGTRHVAKTIDAIIDRIPTRERHIDPAGINQLLRRGHLLGNRTLVKGVQRTPWMARPGLSSTWEYAEVPPHGRNKPSISVLVEDFRKLLLAEVADYLRDRNTVGILLSGGLDSRIVAGIVRELQIRGEFRGAVVGFTWGEANCRDVHYAAEIARRYRWEWERLQLGPEVLKENVAICGKMGAEFAPFHLHALPRLLDYREIDVFLAGNYGDSIGRAEFSGVKLKNLQPILSGAPDRFGLMRETVKKTIAADLLRDAYSYRKHVFREAEYQYRELEYQMHCIRRRSQAVMSHVAATVPLFQVFTHPKVFGYVWGLDLELRDGRIYQHLLSTLPGKIGEIPWARTGTSFGSGQSEGDGYAKQHHRYGTWLRNDLKGYLTDLICRDEVFSLGVFNNSSLEKLVTQVWPRSTTITTNHLDEIVSWLASFSVFVQQHRLGKDDVDYPATQRDRVEAIKGRAYAFIYQAAREKVRK